jgi:hypothetical protein
VEPSSATILHRPGGDATLGGVADLSGRRAWGHGCPRRFRRQCPPASSRGWVAPASGRRASSGSGTRKRCSRRHDRRWRGNVGRWVIGRGVASAVPHTEPLTVAPRPQPRAPPTVCGTTLDEANARTARSRDSGGYRPWRAAMTPSSSRAGVFGHAGRFTGWSRTRSGLAGVAAASTAGRRGGLWRETGR